MGYGTGIGWCLCFRCGRPIGPGASFNAWLGCQKVSPACANCYAEIDVTQKYGPEFWGPEATSSRKMMSESTWRNPDAWNRRCRREGTRMIVFCNSESDVFELHRDVTAARRRLFDVIERTERLIWLLLTKRPENIMHMVPGSWRIRFPENVWIGTSIESQYYADKRMPYLVEVPATLRCVSNEPALGPVDFTPWLDQLGWIKSGGESVSLKDVHRARPTELDWLRDVRDQCAAGGVPWFCKELGTLWARANGVAGKADKLHEWPADLQIQQFPMVAP